MPTLPDNAVALCQEKFGHIPKMEQLQVVEHIGRGEDVVLIAGDGWGKSLVYFIPLVLWKKGVVVVVSPLRAKMSEQTEKLRKLGIKSICLMKGGGKITNATMAELKKGVYRAVFMTPEIMFNNELLKALWYNSEWHSQLLTIVLDDAHCVYTCGNDFRKHYAQLGSLHPKLPSHVAFVALSATMPPDVLGIVKHNAGLAADARVINVGNDRPNIHYIARRLETGNRYHNLDFLLEDPKKTIVHFNTSAEAKEAYDYLSTKSTESSGRSATLGMAAYYSVLSEDYKAEVMEKFRTGQVLILLATEAAAMDCDVNDIIRAVQFGSPPCILTLAQRLGRAARNPNIQGYGVVLYSGHQALGNISDKRVHDFISTITCRREVLNRIFDNQPTPNAKCCDICSPDPFEVKSLKPYRVIYMNKNPRRTQEERAHIRRKLQEWRSKTFKDDYLPRCPFIGEDCVMDDNLLDKLVQSTGLKTPQDILKTFKWTPLKERYYEEVFAIITGAS